MHRSHVEASQHCTGIPSTVADSWHVARMRSTLRHNALQCRQHARHSTGLAGARFAFVPANSPDWIGMSLPSRKRSSSTAPSRASTTAHPALSVVLVSTATLAQAEVVFRRLAPACAALSAEVIVVRAAGPSCATIPVVSELGWQLLEVPAACTSAQMRAEGMAAARGDIVAFRSDSEAYEGAELDALTRANATTRDAERAVPVSDERLSAESGGRLGARVRDLQVPAAAFDLPWTPGSPVAREL